MAAHAFPLRRSSRLKSEHGVLGASPPGEETTGGVKASGDFDQCRTSEKKVKRCSSAPVRQSLRLKGFIDSCLQDGVMEKDERPQVEEKEERLQEEEKEGERVASSKLDYESLREARILENKARMASLGINDKAEELSSLALSTKCVKMSKSSPRTRRVLSTPVRRSERLKGTSANVTERQLCLHGTTDEVTGRELCIVPARKRLFLGRCVSTGRGTIYNSVLGICCHFCRQKTLCWEDDCKHCRDGDLDQPCIGKTDCSSCHSSNGVLCRACLKIRYGEELEDVRRNKNWMCPHCIEEKGINPFWICNSSICLKKRKMAPTGIAIYQAREMGYESVAHLLMYKLKMKLGQQ
ncbi:Zinc-finger domain of monoamine-oxidase A repressor R1 domain-containing protein [Dioscorea alata]|uniref:Zinc-finger domain of monoamine-oxidase A repressor R1 domain-containing protein n=1 Tax=Dioscorea alata TaxID=55571 RepID=A0ACB7TXT2_DIOAL|nr:Zinc-finger domain of monoamine-oxidase A repressor R1 domain-containing protein [Dioscorea alata]